MHLRQRLPWRRLVLPALLWLAGYPIGAFIHGSFIYVGGALQARNLAEGPIKAQLEDLVGRMPQVLILA